MKGRRHCDHRDRGWNDAAKKAKEVQQTPEAGRNMEGYF